MAPELTCHCRQCGQTVAWGITVCAACNHGIVRGWSHSVHTAIAVAYVPVYLGLLAVLITFTPSLVALIVGFPSALVGVKLLQGWEVCPRTADVAARKARGETSLRVAIPCHLWNDPAQEADRGKEILRLLTH